MIVHPRYCASIDNDNTGKYACSGGSLTDLGLFLGLAAVALGERLVGAVERRGAEEVVDLALHRLLAVLFLLAATEAAGVRSRRLHVQSQAHMYKT